MPGDEAREHAGVDGMAAGNDQRDLYAGFTLQPEAPQHFDMSVSAANENQPRHEVIAPPPRPTAGGAKVECASKRLEKQP